MWLNQLTIEQRHKLSLTKKSFFRRGLFFYLFKIKKGRERLNNWKKLKAFSEDNNLYEKSLQRRGITEKELTYILGSAVTEVVPKTHQEGWVIELLDLLSKYQAKELPEALAEFDERGIVTPFLPIIEKSFDSLQFLLDKNHILNSTSAAANLILYSLLQRIEYNVRRAVILELNVKRLKKELGDGDESAQFRVYREIFKKNENQIAFYKKYPILSKYVTTTCRNWVTTSYELLERLSNDWKLISSVLGIPSSAKLSSIEAGGDTHNKGRTVNTLTFDGKYKVIYKPRTVRLEKEFYALLGQFNESNELKLPFRILKVIDRERYGWVEFCSYEKAQSKEDAFNFYYRLGALSSIIYALHGVDIFFENLIACKDQPVIVDLETLFHTDLELRSPQSIQKAADYSIRDSILSMGIFPRPTLSADGKSIFCVSVLGAKKNLQAPYSVTKLHNFGRSDMSLDDVQGWIPETQSSPNFRISRDEMASQIVDGFSDFYEVLEKSKSIFTMNRGFFEKICDGVSRIIVRDTIYYGGLEMDAFHPDLLKNGIDRDWHYENLWSETRTRNYLRYFIDSEIKQIERFDIPYFEMKIGSSIIEDDEGKVYKFDKSLSGYEKAKGRVARLSKDDFNFQNYLLHLVLGSGSDYFSKKLVFSQTDYVQNAIIIADLIEKTLVKHGDKLTSLAVTDILPTGHDIDFRYTIGASNSYLYDGVSGLSHFYAHLYSITNQENYKVSALSLAKTAFESIDGTHSISSYNGLGSFIYLCSTLFSIFGEIWIITKGEKVLENILAHIEGDENYDFLLGSAGLISALAAYIDITNSRIAKEALRNAESHLIRAIETNSIHEKLRFKRGFSHGYTGIAYALAVAAKYTQSSNSPVLISYLLKLEDQLLRDGNWTDEHKNGDKHQVSWCHGAGGIALGRKLINHVLGGDIDSSISTLALTELRMNCWMDSHCICHGTFGNYEILCEIDRIDAISIDAAEMQNLREKLLKHIASDGWCSINQEQSMNIGLMTGLSGLGYSYLRLAYPEKVPSLLYLQGHKIKNVSKNQELQ